VGTGSAGYPPDESNVPNRHVPDESLIYVRTVRSIDENAGDRDHPLDPLNQSRG
jgi:hypothetical protein